ncbi:hypothetical protein EVAR_53744_1 [Eumeta japonica]|uniref:Uncharacterized protein n=1 Tax=Eumeta variegata TaxID=151549 RepID=A0A4C1ZCQ7_EUMVA|nr:hypothetical protein EVAR_53744_1 [Eumeta japonica]
MERTARSNITAGRLQTERYEISVCAAAAGPFDDVKSIGSDEKFANAYYIRIACNKQEGARDAGRQRRLLITAEFDLAPSLAGRLSGPVAVRLAPYLGKGTGRYLMLASLGNERSLKAEWYVIKALPEVFTVSSSKRPNIDLHGLLLHDGNARYTLAYSSAQNKGFLLRHTGQTCRSLYLQY